MLSATRKFAKSWVAAVLIGLLVISFAIFGINDAFNGNYTDDVIKAGSRALLNTSPEPVSNWTASATEDAAVVGGLALAFTHPWLALAIVVTISLSFAFFVWWLWRRLFRRTPRPQAG